MPEIISGYVPERDSEKPRELLPARLPSPCVIAVYLSGSDEVGIMRSAQ